MVTPRKTVSVALLLFKVNHANRYGKATPEWRSAMNTMLEGALFDTGNYKGFGYLHPQDVPAGQAPGVNHVDNILTATMEEKFNGTDRTRVTYYVSTLLQNDYRALQEQQDASVAKYKANGGADAETWLCTDLGR